MGRVVAQVVSRRLLTAEARIRAQVSLCRICGGQSGTGTGFSRSPSAFSCQYHSTATPYSVVYYLGQGGPTFFIPRAKNSFPIGPKGHGT
jgi:hypothetical protein